MYIFNCPVATCSDIWYGAAFREAGTPPTISGSTSAVRGEKGCKSLENSKDDVFYLLHVNPNTRSNSALKNNIPIIISNFLILTVCSTIYYSLKSNGCNIHILLFILLKSTVSLNQET